MDNSQKTMESTGSGQYKIGIDKYIRLALSIVLQAVIFFAVAGRTDIPHVWFFFGVTGAYMLIFTIWFIRKFPDLAIRRFNPGKNTKPWDKVLVISFLSIQYFVVTAVAALDIGRFHRSSMDSFWLIPGYILLILSIILVQWSMMTNPHFEATVRIQTDRDHKVITTGPYRLMRHPGYAGAILWALGVPLALLSLYSYIPSIIVVLLLVIRTYLEDRTLQKELPGYSEYATKTRYRLFPGLW